MWLNYLMTNAVNHKLRNKMKRVDYFAGQGVRRRHSPDYGNDEQRSLRKKTPFHVLIFMIYDTMGPE